MEPLFFHIDVNSAFLSWSALEKLNKDSQDSTLDLRLVPSIIGGDMERRHGVVLAKSSPAKAFGVTTGEPIVSALKKCPHLVIEPPNHALYEAYSHKFIHFLSNYCPDLEQLSIDECFLDFSSVMNAYPSAIFAATKIKDALMNTLGFTVNIGISDKKILAKMASDFQKPNLVHTLFSSEIKEKMWPLPISDLYMCGKSSVDTLHKLGILSIGELAQADREILISHLKSHGALLWQYANGIDDSLIMTTKSEAKGIGNSTTLSKDARTKEAVYPVLLSLAESVASRLRAEQKAASMISVELKYNTFQSVSHQRTISAPSNNTELLYKNACSLFDEIWNTTPIRLLGIRTSKLVSEDEPTQLSLFDLNFSSASTSDKSQHKLQKNKDLDHAIDSIRRKYGDSAIVRGSLLPPKETPTKR